MPTKQYIKKLNGYFVKDEDARTELEKRVLTFDSVAAMKAAVLSAGNHVITKGYYVINDGGGAEYNVVANDNYTEDGGEFIELSNGLFAIVITKDVRPEVFGAKGDGATDDTAAINRAVAYANKYNLPVSLSDKTYVITDSVTLYSGLVINGNGATIDGEFDGPKLSSALVDHLQIENITIIGSGNAEYTNDFGIDTVCYYSQFRNIEFKNLCKGINIGTEGASGTLVENRITGCRFHNVATAADLGADNNNKITDGYFSDNIIHTVDENSDAVHIGSCAGWVIDNIHIYGTNKRGIAVSNGFNTRISNIYIESTSEKLMRLGSVQINVSVSNFDGVIRSANGVGIESTASSYRPYENKSGITLSNISISVATTATNATGISTNRASIVGYVYKSNNDSFTPINTSGDANSIDWARNINIEKPIADGSGQLKYASSIIPLAFKARVEGSSAKTIVIPIDKTMTGYDVVRIRTRIITRTNWDSTKKIDYVSESEIVNKNGSATFFKLEESQDLTAFSVAPSYSFDAANNTLTITFTPAEVSYGCLIAEII